MQINTKYGMGDELKDKVTGYKGIVMGITMYSTGCLHYGLSARTLKDGATLDWHWFDETRVVCIASKVVTFDIPVNTTSGAFPNAPEM